MTAEGLDLPAAVAHDVGAEKAVIGAMLADPEVTTEVRRHMMGADFYQPAHQMIFDAALTLDDNRQPIEPAAVVSELTRTGAIKRIPGGAAYIADLFGDAPPSASVEYYAKQVRDAATRRSLATVGMKIQQMATIDGGSTPGQIVEQMRADLEALAEDRMSSEVPMIGDILDGALDEIDQLARGNKVVGVPTGFHDLDKALNGLAPGQMITIAARPGVGKALALDTPIPTPCGWTTMGEIQVGDLVVGRDGRPTKVVAVTETMEDRDCYLVDFSDKTSVIADADHLWITETTEERKVRLAHPGAHEWREGVRTTREIAGSLRDVMLDPNHGIRLPDPLRLPAVDLPVPPFVLGVCLASGNVDPELTADQLEVVSAARERGVPASYLRASEIQRRAILAGILAGCGVDAAKGPATFVVSSEQLAHDIMELAYSLSYLPTLTSQQGEHRIHIPLTTHVLALPGSAYVRATRSGCSDELMHYRYITAVTAIASVPVRCIEVDNADHTYLAGRAMVPTHNSSLAMDIARNASFRHGKSVIVFSLEMSSEELSIRMLAAEAYVDMADLRTGNLDDRAWQNMGKAATKMKDAKMWIDDTATVTLSEIRAKARAIQRTNGIDLIVIDYLQLMNSDRRSDSRQQEVSDMSRGVKLLAKEFGIPVIILSQLNRGSEQRADKRPVISDLRESGSIEQDSDVVILIHREEMYERETPRAGEADIIIAKQRSGPTGQIVLAWLGRYARFADLAIE